MTNFFDYVAALEPKEKAKFRKRIIKVCRIEPQTWYSWIRRKRVAKQSQILIARELNQPLEILFPEN